MLPKFISVPGAYPVLQLQQFLRHALNKAYSYRINQLPRQQELISHSSGQMFKLYQNRLRKTKLTLIWQKRYSVTKVSVKSDFEAPLCSTLRMYKGKYFAHDFRGESSCQIPHTL